MRKLSISTTAFIAILIMGSLSCNRDENCSIHPEPFRFSIVDAGDGQDLLYTGEYDIDEIGLYYIYNDSRNDLIINREENPAGTLIELFSAQLPMISLTRSEVFFLELDSDNTDTLIIRMGHEMVGGCNYHPYSEVTHNGVRLEKNSDDLFLIEK